VEQGQLVHQLGQVTHHRNAGRDTPLAAAEAGFTRRQWVQENFDVRRRDRGVQARRSRFDRPSPSRHDARMVDRGSEMPPPSFEVEVRHARATAHVVIRGELDLASAPELQRALDGLHGRGVRHIILDLRELEFIDSTGLTIIYRLDQLARQDGFNAAFVRGGPNVQRVFDLVGLTDQLVFVDSPESLAPPPG
jgi:anti-anti-sigma factor